MSRTVQMYIITYKKYEMLGDDCYRPLLAGSSLLDDDFGYLRDDTGDNISDLNDIYSEFTGVYWIWKNTDSDIVGYCHYRRYFTEHIWGKTPITKEEIEDYLEDYELIISKKEVYNVSFYEISYNEFFMQQLDIVRELMETLCPEYIPSFDKVMSRKTAHIKCVFITTRDLFNDYCSWLFKILDEYYDKYCSEYDERQYRICAYLAEDLINVWLDYNQIKIKELYLYNVEAINSFVTNVALYHPNFNNFLQQILSVKRKLIG